MKAVQCMLDRVRKAVKYGSLEGAAAGKALPKPKAVVAGPKRKRTKKQLEAAVDEEDKTENEAPVKKQKADSEEYVEAENQEDIGVETQDSAVLEEEIKKELEIVEGVEETAV